MSCLFHQLLALSIFFVFVNHAYSYSLNYSDQNSTQKRALYLIGDNSDRNMYQHGLVPLLECLEKDPNAVILPEVTNHEQINQSNLTALICNNMNISRIGFYAHWGVAHEHYHLSWKNHRFEGDTKDSVENIKIAFKEFQSRSINDSGIDFVFSSNIWDAIRSFNVYADPDGEIQLFDVVRDFNANFSSIVDYFLERLRPQRDRLILETTYSILRVSNDDWKHLVPIFNIEILDIARSRNLSVLRREVILGIDAIKAPNGYLIDPLHLSPSASRTVAHELINFLDNERKDLV